MRILSLFFLVAAVGVGCQIAATSTPIESTACGCPAEPAPFFSSTNVDVTADMRTIVMKPSGDTLVVHLPVAAEQPGRRITVKVLSAGFVDIHGAVVGSGIDTIDGSFTLAVEGTQSGDQRAVTLEASEAGWIAVAAYP